MIKVGITGGIGSGKSTVCQKWAEMGAYILNADELAKQVMVTDDQVKKQLISTFGQNSYLDDGSLNREHLAKEAFEKERVKELNAIVHPKMPEAVFRKMKEAEETGHEIIVYEAALLLENVEPRNLDYVVLVLADEDLRIKRVQNRDGSSASDIEQRMNKQRDFEKATGRVDYVIRNNGSIDELKKKAEVIYKNFLGTNGDK